MDGPTSGNFEKVRALALSIATSAARDFELFAHCPPVADPDENVPSDGVQADSNLELIQTAASTAVDPAESVNDEFAHVEVDLELIHAASPSVAEARDNFTFDCDPTQVSTFDSDPSFRALELIHPAASSVAEIFDNFTFDNDPAVHANACRQVVDSNLSLSSTFDSDPANCDLESIHPAASTEAEIFDNFTFDIDSQVVHANACSLAVDSNLTLSSLTAEVTSQDVELEPPAHSTSTYTNGA